MKRVIIASQNPVKIQATQTCFERLFPKEDFQFDGVAVDSGVSQQPWDNKETHQGAVNRAKAARQHQPEADFFVGMEGGVEKVAGVWQAFAWMVVFDKTGKMGEGRTGVFIIPRVVGKLLDDGVELGPADDQVFGMHNSKQKLGAVGILTNGAIDRTKYYEQALTFALIPWLHPELY